MNVLLILLATLAQDKAEMRWKFAKGDTMQLVWKMHVTTSADNLPKGEDPVDYKNDVEVEIVGDGQVKEVADGKATIEVKVTRFASGGLAYGKRSNIVFENGAIKKADVELENFDRAKTVELISTPIRFTLDGRGNAKVEPWQASSPPSFFGGLLPEKPVALGDTWAETVSKAGGGVNQDLTLACKFEKTPQTRCAFATAAGEAEFKGLGAKVKVKLRRETTFALDGGYVVSSVEDLDQENVSEPIGDQKGAPTLVRSRRHQEFRVKR